MMQIIHIIPGKANPNTMNGVNKVVDAIATEQVRLGYKTMVIGVANNTQHRHEPIYEYKLYKKSNIPFFYPNGLLKFLLENSSENTVFHFHSVFVFWFLPLIKSLKKNGRCHIFLTPHGQYIDDAMKSMKKRVAFSLFDSKVLQEVEAVQVIGYKTENNDFIKNNAKRIAVIPNGFGGEDVPIYKKGKDLVFGYLGRLECRQKGLDILIPAFVNYKKNGGNGTLRLAGSGPDEHKLRKMVEDAGMNDCIFFDGVLYGVNKWKFLYRCSVFVHPSRWDVVPTACLEAAYAGCPLLVSDATNIGDMVDKYKCGLCLTTLGINTVQNAMTEYEIVFNNESHFKKESSNAKRMVDEDLNWNVIARNMVKKLYLI